MPIAFDAVTLGTMLTAASIPGTIVHTITGANPVLLVGNAAQEGADFSTENVTASVTFNGTAMTRVVQARRATAGADTGSDLWVFPAPPTGAGSIVIGSTNSDSTPERIIAVMSFTGVDQTTPIVGSVSTNNSNGTVAGTVTTVNDNDWLVECSMVETGTAGTIASAQTQTMQGTAGGNGVKLASYKGPVSPVGSGTISWTIAANNWTSSMAVITPVAAAGGVTAGWRSLMGVGL